MRCLDRDKQLRWAAQSFIWRCLRQAKKDIKFPPYGQDAVTILTYHKAKGLQWPVVILSGLHSDRGPSLWEPHVSGGGEDINQPLTGRSVRVWTWPFGKSDGQFPKLRTGTRLELDVVNSPGGSKEQQKSKKRICGCYMSAVRVQSRSSFFAHRAGSDAWLQRLPGIDAILPIDVSPGEHNIAGIDTTFVLRQLTPAPLVQVDDVSSETWLQLLRSKLEVSPRFHSPSQDQSHANSAKTNRCDLVTLSGESYFPSDVSEEEYAALGHAVHAYMAAIPSLSLTGKERKLAVAEKCLVAFSVEGKLASSTLVEVGNRFEQWITSTFPNAKWRVEVPVTAGRSEGGAWNGTLDLILELPDGKLVVIDHKSAPIRRSHCETKALQYAGNWKLMKKR